MPLTPEQRLYIQNHFSKQKALLRPSKAIKQYEKRTDTLEDQLAALKNDRKPVIFTETIESLYEHIKITANAGDFKFGAQQAKELLSLVDQYKTNPFKMHVQLIRAMTENLNTWASVAAHVGALTQWLNQEAPTLQPKVVWDGNARKAEFAALPDPQKAAKLKEWYESFYTNQVTIQACPRPEKRITPVLSSVEATFNKWREWVDELDIPDPFMVEVQANLKRRLNAFNTTPRLDPIRALPGSMTLIDPQALLTQYTQVMSAFQNAQATKLEDLESMWNTLEQKSEHPKLESLKDIAADLHHQTVLAEVARNVDGAGSAVRWESMLSQPIQAISAGDLDKGLTKLKSQWDVYLTLSGERSNNAVFEVLSLTEEELLKFLKDQLNQSFPELANDERVKAAIPKLAETLKTGAFQHASSTLDPAQGILQLKGQTYTVSKKLAAGAAGEVFRYLDAQGNGVIVKVPLASNPDDAKSDMAAELRVHRHLMKANPNDEGFEHLVKLYDAAYDAAGGLYVVMEEVRGGNLDAQHQTLSFMAEAGIVPHELQQIFQSKQIKQLAKALLLMKRRNVIHFDIKPENVLLTHEGSVKLADFGSGKISKSPTGENPEQGIGTRGFYVPNRATEGHQYDDRDDVFSLGRLMQMLAVGAPQGEHGSLEKKGTVLNQLIAGITTEARGSQATIESVVQSSYLEVGDYVEEVKLIELHEQIKRYAEVLNVRAKEMAVRLLEFDPGVVISLGKDGSNANGQKVIFNCRFIQAERRRTSDGRI